jgi:hypothetical protein
VCELPKTFCPESIRRGFVGLKKCQKKLCFATTRFDILLLLTFFGIWNFFAIMMLYYIQMDSSVYTIDRLFIFLVNFHAHTLHSHCVVETSPKSCFSWWKKSKCAKHTTPPPLVYTFHFRILYFIESPLI